MSALPSPHGGRPRRRPLALAAPDTLATTTPIPFPSRRAEVGLVEWFRPGEYERAEQALADLQALGVRHLRTCISWAECHTPTGMDWYQWLLPRLARQVEVLPCLLYTPPSLGVVPKTSAPPRRPKDYADFADEILTRFGQHFEYLELWDEPTSFREWDWTRDQQWLLFCEMIGGAAYRARQRGYKTVLGGIAPVDPDWLRMLFDRGLMEHIDVVGFHGFPDNGEHTWDGWGEDLGKVQRLLDEHHSPARVWITEAGVSTWRHNEFRQCEALVEVLDVPVPRVYWYSLHDLDPALPTVDGFHTDERAYHFGLKGCDGTPKLLFRLWSSGGLAGVRETSERCRRPSPPRLERPIAITGGCGFIGTNLAHRLASSGRTVLVLDNLSRPGVEENLRWLQETHGDRVQVEIGDVRDPFALHAIGRASQVFHFAAQVAVTTSLADPIADSEVNVRGTLNLLEVLRGLSQPPPLVFTSTSKVYGNLAEVALVADGTRYQPADEQVLTNGIDEAWPLDFCSPYGCSKGAADQYVLDYARTYRLPAAVFRMSCVYGPHQRGCEHQGWVAHFLLRALEGEPITIFGDGKQVRDVLYVDDLVDALLLAQQHIEEISGEAFNIGGGVENTLSLLELVDLIAARHGRQPEIRYEQWRPGDQRYYVSDTRKFRQATGWAPKVNPQQGVAQLYQWLREAAHPHVKLISFSRAAS